MAALPPDSELEELVVIPARWGSTRFPGKPLHLILGKPLVQHVWERCQAVPGNPKIVVATDDDRIAEEARNFGAEVAMTKADHPSGTDRIAEVVEARTEIGPVVNVQGDEPLVDPALVRELLDSLQEGSTESRPEMVTAATPISDPAEVTDPNIVKVVLAKNGDALYFSRSPIPFVRDGSDSPGFLRHLGIYGYHREFLLRYVQWPPAPLEQAESLEQLRALHHGAVIRVAVTDHLSPGVDTPEQVAAIESILSSS